MEDYLNKTEKEYESIKKIEVKIKIPISLKEIKRKIKQLIKK